MYGLDAVIMLCAIGAAVTANPERKAAPFARRLLLLPGLLAFAGTIILLAYPDIRDLADPAVWLIASVGATAGGLRGWGMTLESDRAHGLVRVMHGRDAVWVAWIMVLFAAVQGTIETGLRAENPYEATAELFMLLASGYLLGRSVVAWLRARAATHQDLFEV
jgi:hypothetical protein